MGETPTFQGCAFPTLALAEEENLHIRSVPLELCAFHTELLVNSIADLLSLLFCKDAHFALGGRLVEGWAKDGVEGIIVRGETTVLGDGPGTNHSSVEGLGGWDEAIRTEGTG